MKSRIFFILCAAVVALALSACSTPGAGPNTPNTSIPNSTPTGDNQPPQGAKFQGDPSTTQSAPSDNPAHRPGGGN